MSIRSTVAFALGALIVATVVAAPHPALASADATAAAPTTNAVQPLLQPAVLTASRVELLGLINAKRAQAGLGALVLVPALTVIAQARSRDMIARHYFSHQIPGGGMVFDILDHKGITYQMAGENIAMNSYFTNLTLAQTIQHTDQDLWNSPEHRANMLDPHYAQVGLGVAIDQATRTTIVTEVFVQP